MSNDIDGIPLALEDVGSLLPPPGWPIELLDAPLAETAESPDDGLPPLNRARCRRATGLAPDEANVLPLGEPLKP